MVERLIRSDVEIEGYYRKTGVVVFILNREGKILLLQETGTHDTDGGQAWQFSIYCETTNAGEQWPETVIRGLREELGATEQQVGQFMLDTESGVLGESLFSADVLARIAVLYWVGDQEEALSFTGDGEVRVVGWFDPEQALHYPLRPGVRKILTECIEEGQLTRSRLVKPQNLVPASINNLWQTANNLLEAQPRADNLATDSSGKAAI